MTVVPFPSSHLADRVRHCVEVYQAGDNEKTVGLIVDYAVIIEGELDRAGFDNAEIQRQVEAFYQRVVGAMTRVWLAS